MVDRIGDWYAFSSACYCRSTTVYEDMYWDSGFTARQSEDAVTRDTTSPAPLFALQPSFSFLAYCGGVVAPFGGLVALIRPATADSPFGAASAAVGGSAQAYSYAIDIFTSAGEFRGTFGVAASDGDVCGMEWTTEGVTLCVLTASYNCLFFEASGDMDVRDGLLAAPSAWRPCAYRMSLATPEGCPGDAGSSFPAQPHTAAGVSPSSSTASVPSLACFAVTPTHVTCVGVDHALRALLHDERGRPRLLPRLTLPHTVSDARQFHVTAVALLPDSVSEDGETCVYWSESAVYPQERVVAANDDHVLCAMRLSSSDGGASLSSSVEDEREPSAPGRHRHHVVLPLRGRAHHLQLCPHDPTRLVLLTVRGTLHIISSDLQQQQCSVDLAFGAAAELVLSRLSSGYDGGVDNTSLSATHNFSLINASITGEDFTSGAAPVLSSSGPAARSPFGCSGVGAVATPATTLGLTHQRDAAVAGLLPTTTTWCGTNFVLLHYGTWRATSAFGDDGDGESCFSLLTCLYPSAGVRCARLDWSLEGASGRVLCSAEVDGARIVSEGRCLMLHEVPPSLVDLCRLSAPYSASARVVLAFEEYAAGGYQGLAQVRAALLESESETTGASPPLTTPEAILARARTIFVSLIDAATWEWDAERQKRLLSAASFANNMCQFTNGSEVLVGVMKRLRVWRAVREAPRCHMPLTPAQYRVLNGDWTAVWMNGEAAADEAIELSGSDRDDNDMSDMFAAGAEEAMERWRISKNEAQILVDRLVALGQFRLALEVASALGTKAARVVTYWAQEQVKHADARAPTQELVSRIEQVLSHVPDASYNEAASTALSQGRAELAQRLLQAETRPDRRVELLLQHGIFSASAQCASDSGDANLLFLSLNALVQRVRGQTLKSGAGEQRLTMAPEETQALLTLRQHCPAAFRYFLRGAGFLSPWKALAARCAADGLIPNATLGDTLLEDTLWGHNARQWSRLAQDLSLFLAPLDPLLPGSDDGDDGADPALKPGRKKRKKAKKQNADEAATVAMTDDEATVYTVPAVEHTKPSRIEVCADLSTGEIETILDYLDTAGSSSRRKISDGSAASASVALDAKWLAQQRDLDTVKEQLVTRYQDPQFYRAASVVDVMKCLYAHNAADLAVKIGNMFGVSEPKRLFACLEVLCETGQWAQLDAFLASPPSLRKTRFFSRSDRDGGGGAATKLGYLPLVETLLRYGQEERAAQFIPGVTEDVVERVQWYMTLRAPVMAMEAAFVAKDGGLIQQVLSKVPSNSVRVIEKGQEMLRQLQDE